MKVNITRQDITFYGLQVAAWLAFLMVPAISAFIATQSWTGAMRAFDMNARIHWSSAAIYFLNALVLVPWGYYRNRRWMFWGGNALILIGLVYIFFYDFNPKGFIEHIPDERHRQFALANFYASSLVAILMSAFLAGIALLVHHVRRTMVIKQQLKEEHQKRTEAELEWLKNQLNPHFLFNTLNNISSLVQIDADKAQDAIAQLSDLMRYAMYETRREMVPIQGEVEFMRNYIELMKLRCNDKTEVNVQWSIGSGPPALHLTHRECLQAWRQQQPTLEDRHPPGAAGRQPRLHLRQHELPQGRYRPQWLWHRSGEHPPSPRPPLWRPLHLGPVRRR